VVSVAINAVAASKEWIVHRLTRAAVVRDGAAYAFDGLLGSVVPSNDLHPNLLFWSSNVSSTVR
jgi:hypothetical protein